MGSRVGPPGWYPDPRGSGQSYFWNGRNWSCWTGQGWAPGPQLPPPNVPSSTKSKSRTLALVLACGAAVLTVGGIGAVAAGSREGDIPSDQERFLGAVDSVADTYKSAASDLQRSAAVKNVGAGWCSALASAEVTGWIGKVKHVDSTLGYATVRVEISERAEVRTTSAVPFDVDTLIAPESPLFQKAASLSEGQRVRFSGSFIPDTATCIKEESLTGSGRTETPDFLFKFSSIDPL